MENRPGPHDEWWDLYDDEDHLVGRHLRGQELPKGTHHDVVTVITLNSKHEVLLTQRALQKTYAGEWETTAGSVLAGETLREAAIRELYEETGISCAEDELIYLGILLTTEGHARMHGYALLKDISLEEITLQEGETIDVKWHPLQWSLISDPKIARPVQIRFCYYWRQLDSLLHPIKRVEPWLSWAKKLQAIAQTGIEYTKDSYDEERFQMVSAIAREIMSFKTGISDEKVLGLFANEKGYQTPKVEVRAAVFRADKVLLVQERKTQRWSMPGGWCDIGLGLAENTIKECREEAGIDVDFDCLIAIENRSAHDYSSYPYEIYKCYLLCQEQDPSAFSFEENIETMDARFFPVDDLPALAEDRVNERSIRMCWEASKDKNWIPRID